MRLSEPTWPVRCRWQSTASGGLNVVVANAGIGDVRPFLEIDDEGWQPDARCQSQRRVLRDSGGCARHHRNRRAGAVVVTASTNAFFPERHTVALQHLQGRGRRLRTSGRARPGRASASESTQSRRHHPHPARGAADRAREAARDSCAPSRDALRRERRDRRCRAVPRLGRVDLHHRAEHRGGWGNDARDELRHARHR